ncbi:DMT family transporter [Paracoccus caeni]|uniref:DMT family transporter n=2 Tax=Paracoccus caeni TaxID=657651 RepID=A0A934SG22_9RHOB|nr:DMT family transporter [Paracoccus caeni]
MDRNTAGWLNGLIGVVIFSGSLPATRIAVGGFSPFFLTSTRAVIAALLGSLLLLLLRQRPPTLSDLGSLLIVAAGVVIGFPLLTALALQHITSAHSIVFVGLLPLATALFGVLRGAARPHPAFWLFSGVGALAVAFFALSQSNGGNFSGDSLMIAAIIVCGLGYAEGAVLSRRLGGWQVISWALLISVPVMLPAMLMTWPTGLARVSLSEWLSLGYVSVFSMLVGFVFWYRGLVLGGITGVSQLQLLQPFFGLSLAALLLKEPVAPTMIAMTLVVVACVAMARRYA